MLSYQKNYYKTYAILMEDGTELDVSRSECFAKGEEPTEDNPYKQRWYYSPDREIAIRLPRSEKGEAIYRANSADLKDIEVKAKREGQCIGTVGKGMCHISCVNCKFKDDCHSELRFENGRGCRKKCEDCFVFTSKCSSFDSACVDDSNGDSVTREYDSGVDVEDEFLMNEDDLLYSEDVKHLISSLNSDERLLYDCIKSKMSLSEIAGIFGLSTKTITNRKNRLKEKFSSAWLNEERKRTEAIKDLLLSLSDDERDLYNSLRLGMTLKEVAAYFGVAVSTVQLRQKKLLDKFREAGLEKYF
ncbi:MAG: hypothetical protein LUE20_04840 [Oscillospiraceae bacterium]|nr:hypothetical protein [Oscillospiraceae bacterium]